MSETTGQKISEYYRHDVGAEVSRCLDTMEGTLDACRAAVRSYKEGQGAPDDLTTAVLHELAWGFANASTKLESAIRGTSRMHEADRSERDR